MIRSALLLFGLFILAQNGYSQTNKAIYTELEKMFDAKAFDYASVGLSVRDESGKEVIQHNNNVKLIPASSLKLVTTLSAVQVLGQDYSFLTKVGYSGDIDRSGTLEGDLIIIGTGDPTLGSKKFGQSIDQLLSQIIKVVQEKGIRCIEGNIEIRTNVFTGQNTPPSWPHSDIANYYGSGAWALNFNDNEYEIHFVAKTKEGNTAKIQSLDPKIPYLDVQSVVITKGKNTGDNAYIYGDPYHYRKIVRGSIPYSTKPFKIRGSIPNPPLSFSALLAQKLEKEDILSEGIRIESTPIKKSNFRFLLELKSDKLKTIIQLANYESVNLYCEALLRLMAKKEKKEGSIDAGVQYLEDRLINMGIDKYSFRIEDGSGLSPRNGITTSAFTKYLHHTSEAMNREDLLKLIPQAGVSGTVKSLQLNKQSKNRFYLKSGSMGGVLSYTGYFQAKSGKWHSISFISNNHSRGNRSIRTEAVKLFDFLYQSL